MAEGINSLIDKLPLEVKTFLDLDKQGKENLFGFEYITFSSKKDSLDKLLTNIFHDIVSQRAGAASNLHNYISQTIGYEYNNRKHGIVTVNTIFNPEKIVIGFSGDNGYFKDKVVKEYYDNKKCNSPVCKLSDFVHVESEKDKVYFGKKI